MSNVTTPAVVIDDFASLRIALIFIGILLTLATIYVFTALVTHRVRTAKRKKRELLQQQQDGSRRSFKRKEMTTPWLDNLGLAGSLCACLNCCTEFTVFYTVETSDVACQVMQCFSFVFYAAGLACLYSFLWKRQRACYISPTLAQLHSRFTRILSAVILPVFLVMMVAGMILTAVLWKFETSPIGCIEKVETNQTAANSEETTQPRIALIVLYAGSVAMQLTLFVLFMRPLNRHAMFKKSSETTSDKIMVALVKRSIITTILCVVSDTLAFSLAIGLPLTTPFIVINLLYDANLLCNVLCIIGSFADWRQRLAPWCSSYAKVCDRRRPGTSLSSSARASTTVI